MAVSSGQARAIFLQLIDQDTKERSARVSDLRTSDPSLAAEVESLLAFSAQESGILPLDPDEADQLRPGDRVGEYEVLGRLGRGGMGEVYRVARPDVGEFALKVLHRGLSAARFQERFVAEQRAMSRLRSDRFARLVDAGSLENGRPYLVMELVEGTSLTDAITEKNQPERLRLFIDLCKAVEDAHGNLVVHGDLKPSNVLFEDDKVKIVDLGLATILEQETEEGSPSEAASLRALTPTYASPEQFLGEAPLVPSDVFALGVILLEMLGVDLDDQWTEQEASSLAEALSARSDALERVMRSVKQPELAAICRSACETDRDKRYESVSGLRLEVERFLEGMPVRAYGENRWYVARKFVMRHRVPLSVGSLLLAGLGAGALTLWSLSESRRKALDDAVGTVNQLSGILQSVNPVEGGHPEATVADALQDAAASVEDSELSSHAQALLLFQIGRSLGALGKDGEARQPLLKSIDLWAASDSRIYGDPQVGRADALNSLAGAYEDAGEWDPALAAFRESRDLLTRAAIADPLPAAATDASLGRILCRQHAFDEAHEHFDQALSAFPKTSEKYPGLLLIVAQCRLRAKQTELARPLVEESLQLRAERWGEDSLEYATGLGTRAEILTAEGKREEALEITERIVEIKEGALGKDHPDYYSSLADLGTMLYLAGERERAVEVLTDSLEGKRRLLGRDHFDVITNLNNLGRALKSVGRLEEARGHYQESVSLSERLVGPDHPKTLIRLVNYADLVFEVRDFPEAGELYRDVMARHRADDVASLRQVARARLGLAKVAAHQRESEADSLFQEAVEAYRESYGERTRQWANALAAYSVYKRDLLGDPEGALRLQEVVLSVREEISNR